PRDRAGLPGSARPGAVPRGGRGVRRASRRASRTSPASRLLGHEPFRIAVGGKAQGRPGARPDRGARPGRSLHDGALGGNLHVRVPAGDGASLRRAEGRASPAPVAGGSDGGAGTGEAAWVAGSAGVVTGGAGGARRARPYNNRSGLATVRGPPASPVLTVEIGSKSITRASFSATGRCSTP